MDGRMRWTLNDMNKKTKIKGTMDWNFSLPKKSINQIGLPFFFLLLLVTFMLGHCRCILAMILNVNIGGGNDDTSGA